MWKNNENMEILWKIMKSNCNRWWLDYHNIIKKIKLNRKKRKLRVELKVSVVQFNNVNMKKMKHMKK